MNLTIEQLRSVLNPALTTAVNVTNVLPNVGALKWPKQTIALFTKLVADDETMQSFANLLNKLSQRAFGADGMGNSGKSFAESVRAAARDDD